MKGYFSVKLNRNRAKFILFDFTLLFISIVIAYSIRFGFILKKFSQLPIDRIIIYYLILLAQVTVLFYIVGLYERWGIANFGKTIIKLFISTAAIGMFNGLIFYFFQTIYIGRTVFILQPVIFFVLAGMVKFIIIMKSGKKERKNQIILVNLTKNEKELVLNEPAITKNYEFVEFQFKDKLELENFIRNLDGKSITVISSASKIVERHIDAFISLKFNKFNIYDIETFYSNVTGMVPINSLPKLWNLISENEFVMGISSYYNLKRLIDIVFSIIVLIMTSPFFIIIPFLIKLSSRGPVFYTQERLGWNKKPFKLIKFRTMLADAEKETGPKWASESDARITKVGKILRYTHIDELPQLINVLKNDMSFVGNRPIRKHFSDELARNINYYDLRFFIKPGLTGWAQVHGSYAVPDGEKTLQYELFYLKNMGLVFDLVILLKTLKTVFSLKGR